MLAHLTHVMPHEQAWGERSVLLRKHRLWSEVAADPRTPYMIGRLLGANEMAAALLAREDNEVAKKVASTLEGVIQFFLEENGRILTIHRGPEDG